VCVILDERFKPLKRISFDCATFGTRFNTPVFIFFVVVAEIVLSFVSFSSRRECFVSSPPEEEEEDEEDESEATLNGVVVFRRFVQKVPKLLCLLLVVIFPPPRVLERHKQQLTLVVVFVNVALENDALIEENMCVFVCCFDE